MLILRVQERGIDLSADSDDPLYGVLVGLAECRDEITTRRGRPFKVIMHVVPDKGMYRVDIEGRETLYRR